MDPRKSIQMKQPIPSIDPKAYQFPVEKPKVPMPKPNKNLLKFKQKNMNNNKPKGQYLYFRKE